MASRMKTVPVGVDTVIDSRTSEVLHQKVLTREVLVKDSEEWFNTYAKLVRVFCNLDGNEVKVLFWCALAATVNSNEVTLNLAIKTRMSAEIGLAVGTIENALGRLVSKGFMHRTARGVYHLDPDSTWRGDLKSRAKNIQVFLNYKIEKP
jgi:hypothetical protein